MSEPYPLPAHACSVWAVDNALSVAFPATRGEKAHTIAFPMNERGIVALLAVLRVRSQQSDLRLGTAGSPTKAEMQDAIANSAKFATWLKAMGEDRAAKAAAMAEAEAYLKEIGL